MILLAAACSGDEPAPATHDGAPAGETAHDGDQHGHGTIQELAEGVPVPTIEIEVTKDPVEGWNLRIHTTNFGIVPENVSTAHADGEGHMHLYIDSEKVSRVYGPWHHIGPLEPGEHAVRVELSSNNHSALAVGGEIIDAAAVIVADETGDHTAGHGHDHGMTREAVEPLPSVSIEIVDDPAGGWSLRAEPSNFRLAPENASGAHVDGEGHMHLYVNGDKVARLYNTWFEMPPLPSGVHEIRVDLQSNDHAPMTVNGTTVDAVATLEVSEDEATMDTGHDHDSGHDHDTGHDHDSGHDHDTGHDGDHAMPGAPTRYDADLADAAQTITVEAVAGSPVGGVQRVAVELGSVVALMVTSDGTEEVHVHGYDILRAVSEGNPAHFAFNAEIPGVFEVEFEGSGRLLLQLEIS